VSFGSRPRATYAAVYLREKEADWPVDIGDDPAFEASSVHAGQGGVVSWGVCRRDLRNEVQPGDLVIMFAADRLADRTPARYAFVGYMTVDRKVSQRDIWEDESLAVFRTYRNLLIRPSDDGGYVHDEPVPRSLWHKDWLWRTTAHRGARKKDLEHIEATDAWSPNITVHGRPLRFAANYILFRPEGDGTFVAASPPIVARATTNGRSEDWIDTRLSTELYKIVVEGSGTRRDGLRTRNPQTAHRHIKLAELPSLVRSGLDSLTERYGIAARGPAT
jgi:hypothetical protein